MAGKAKTYVTEVNVIAAVVIVILRALGVSDAVAYEAAAIAIVNIVLRVLVKKGLL